MAGGEQRRPAAPRSMVPADPVVGPIPLGCEGVAVASAVYAAAELRWVPVDQLHVAALTVLLLTVPLQLMSAVLAFTTRDPASGTGAALLSGSWAVIAVVTLTSSPGSRSAALGVFLLVASLALIPPVVAGAAKQLAALVMAGSACRFVLTAITQLAPAPFWRHLAGAGGLALSALALYAALAYEMQAVRRRPVLPTGTHTRTPAGPRGEPR